MKPKPQISRLQPRFLIALLVLGILLNTACSLPQVSLFSAAPSTGDLLTIDQVRQGDEPGQFQLSGTVDLPIEVPLTVSAVRPLNAAQGNMAEDAPPIFGILDRRTATVEDGRWQATLNLWETNGEGYYQELWQRPEIILGQAVQPRPNVEFLVTVEPKGFAQAFQSVIPEPMKPAIDRLRYVTPAGETYLRVSTTQPLAIPDGTIRASRRRVAQDTVSPWAGRSTLDGPNAAAAIPVPPFSEEDNLPIPPERMMR